MKKSSEVVPVKEVAGDIQEHVEDLDDPSTNSIISEEAISLEAKVPAMEEQKSSAPDKVFDEMPIKPKVNFVELL
ncbi:unnamed protein product [Cuscuta campestris]|nr:unnamed protein product [Cuscuta campestris]